ncbi:MAG: TetR/AcrR family transcriptional regulator [Deltaproteobacteria bacterium]|nr:TetR/AcrR family transcriptional regulator [Deltaproteobacteria bacterium]
MPKIVNRNEYRQKLLEKSLYLFSRKGYHNINMKEIAAEIGVSTGTLYHYFPSKENMLAEMIAWIGDKNVEEYIQRTSSIESIKDRFDMIVDFWKEKSELYENIVLLAIDMYRNTDIEQWKAVYSFFSERYTAGMSERLNISRQFARSIFIYFIGLSFHSLAFDGDGEYNKQIDFLDTIFRPPIVDAPEDMEKAAQNFKKVTRTFLMNSLVTEKATMAKKIKSTRMKKAETKPKKVKAKRKA